MTTAFIGDIHGCAEALRSVMRQAEHNVDHLVFLGDYVDRGPNSRLVIEELIQIQRAFPNRTSFLQGNHDVAFLEILTHNDGLDTFLKMGGAKTIRSYIEPPYHDTITRLRRAVPRAHRDFLASLDTRYSGTDVLAVHDAQDAPRDGRFLVAGHATQANLVPTIGDSSAFIDTGCGTRRDGRLTCLVWPSLEWWQSDNWTNEKVRPIRSR